MAVSQIEEYVSTFDNSGNPPGASVWLNTATALAQINNALRIPSGFTSTIFAQRRTASLLPLVYVEATSEVDFGNFGNSWGIYAGVVDGSQLMSGSNPGYLVRLQYNNLKPALFRVSLIDQAVEYQQVASADAFPNFQRGDKLGLRIIPRNGVNICQIIVNDVIALTYTDNTPLPVGRFGGLRMSRNPNSGPSTTGVTRYAGGSLAERITFAAEIAFVSPSLRALNRQVEKWRRGTVALVSTVRTAPLKGFAGRSTLSGKLTRKQLSAERRAAKRADLLPSSWSAFLLRPAYNSELINSSPWRLMLEGNPVIAGSIEELRIGVNYVYEGTAPLPTSVDVSFDGLNWVPADVQQVSASRAVVSLIVGPFLRGTYPVQVRFSTGVQTPILFAGNLSVY